MIQPKRMITIAGTVVCALGIGYFMQDFVRPSGPGKAQPATQQVASAGMLVTSDAVSRPAKDASSPEQSKSDVALDDVTLTSANPTLPTAPDPERLPDEPMVTAALDDTPVADIAKDLPQEEPAPGFTCDYDLKATPQDAAMVRLELSAPCMPNERFTLHHNGMMFTDVTDKHGARDFKVPALAETSVFIVAFSNGDGAVANAQVPTFQLYDRAVVQWKGESGMKIHALEYGSDYGGDGHVWADADRDGSSAAPGESGFLTRLGAAELDNALLAEVYTFPTAVANREGDIVLSVEAEVTQANCGRDVEAQSLQKRKDGTLKSQDLVLAMPECSAIGDYLVLKNLLNDLKIARN